MRWHGGCTVFLFTHVEQVDVRRGPLVAWAVGCSHRRFAGSDTKWWRSMIHLEPMGDVDVQRAILDAIDALGGNVDLAALVQYLSKRGMDDQDMVISSLLPLIYSSEIEFTPDRHLRINTVAA
jgi:hypothetical protein